MSMELVEWLPGADPHLLISGLGIASDQRSEPEPVLSSNFGWLRFRESFLVACSGEWPTTALLLPPTSTRDSGCDEGLGPRQ